MAEPSTSQTSLHPQVSALWGLSGCAPSCSWPVTDCTANLRHITLPEPLEKKHSHMKCPEIVYYLIVLFITTYFPSLQLPSELRLHIQTANTSTIHQHNWATQPRIGLNPFPLYHICAAETSTPWQSALPQVLHRREAEASWSSSSQPPPLLIQPECMFIYPEKAKCLNTLK